MTDPGGKKLFGEHPLAVTSQSEVIAPIQVAVRDTWDRIISFDKCLEYMPLDETDHNVCMWYSGNLWGSMMALEWLLGKAVEGNEETRKRKIYETEEDVRVELAGIESSVQDIFDQIQTVARSLEESDPLRSELHRIHDYGYPCFENSRQEYRDGYAPHPDDPGDEEVVVH